MNPDQTAPFRSILIWIHVVCIKEPKVPHEVTKQLTTVLNSGETVNKQEYARK